MAKKPILCLDFDGVIHCYRQGWSGPRVITCPPVDGAIDFIIRAMDVFEVHIFSSRSRYWGGRRAMKKWLRAYFIKEAENEASEAFRYTARKAFADPWDDEVDWAAGRFIKEIKWPMFKPPAMVSIDDRAVTFTGEWPDIKTLSEFKPWNK